LFPPKDNVQLLMELSVRKLPNNNHLKVHEMDAYHG
jgi:hypothetical protein